MGIVSRWAKDIGRKAAKRALEERKGEISEAIVEAVKPELTRAVERVVADHFRKSPRFRFIKYMIVRDIRHAFFGCAKSRLVDDHHIIGIEVIKQRCQFLFKQR